MLINYRDQDFVEQVRAATGGAGADVILDIVGAKYLAQNIRALAMNGRILLPLVFEVPPSGGSRHDSCGPPEGGIPSKTWSKRSPGSVAA